jgi:acetyl-CoA carboxylase carboxyl transferase subunit alpha
VANCIIMIRSPTPMASARNLQVMAELRVPIVCTVIGEGGSGGALAIGVGDRIMMMQFATYSVISPEGCASILWKSAEKAPQAAEAMGITSGRLKELGLIDEIIPEPLGGAHRDPGMAAENLRNALSASLQDLRARTVDELLEQRYERLMRVGRHEG